MAQEKIIRYMTPVEDAFCRSVEARTNTTAPALEGLRQNNQKPGTKRFWLRVKAERLIRSSNPYRDNAPWTVPASTKNP